MRVAINLLTEDPANPSGAHWFWTRVIPGMARRPEGGEVHARAELGDRQLAIVGSIRDDRYGAALHALMAELGIGSDVGFVGGVPLDETVRFYRAADVFVYPSFNETFGLPILEALDAGASGAKLTGSGGGFLLVICPAERQRAVRESLAAMQAFPVGLDYLGSRMVLNVLRDIWS